jgi:hypothetical protein
MQKAIDNLYATFSPYRLGDDFSGCEHCVSPTESARLASIPLRSLTYDDLERYSRKAMTTWGNSRHFKHFLPRIFELTIDHANDFLDLAVVFGKLNCAGWTAWRRQEQNAIHRFFHEYWEHQLDQPCLGTFDDTIDTVLCAISSALTDVQPLLQAWTTIRIDSAKRHLAAFLYRNDVSLVKKGQLVNPFWDRTQQPHRQVLAWLQSDELLDYLSEGKDSILVDDFIYALPQLLAIRSALAEGR